MSLAAMSWAIGQKIKRPAQKLVLIILANRVNRAALAPVSFPSVASVCADTSLDRKTVMAALAELQAAGLIEDTGVRYGSTRQVVCYRLCIPGYRPEGGGKNGTVGENITGNSPENGTLSGENIITNSTVFPYSDTENPCEESQKRDTEPVSLFKEQPGKAKKSTRAAPRSHFSPPGLPSWLPLPEWNAYLEMRTIKRAFMTEHAMRLTLQELAKLGRDGHNPADVLNQSTQNTWTGVFPVKQQRRIVGRSSNADAATEAARMILEAEDVTE